MSIVLMDTSVFCNVIDVPGRNQERDQVLSALEGHIKAKANLLLPMAAVVETGNHIAKTKLVDGQTRRKAAQRFRDSVLKAVDGETPWTPTPFWDLIELRTWLGDFPDQAMKGVGMGDLSILKEWERQCELHRLRRVLIWSLDGDLQGYDRKAK